MLKIILILDCKKLSNISHFILYKFKTKEKSIEIITLKNKLSSRLI